MTIRHVFDHFVKSLSSLYEKQEAENITHWIFEEKLGLTKTGLLIHGTDTISEVKANDLAYKLVRLMKGEPVQYVLGHTEFYGLKLKVNKSVLIPRPETEELVQWIIKDHEGHSPFNIIDIGTGSGCIAIALKKNLPQSTVYAIDISEAAIQTAKENAELMNVEIIFSQEDIFKLADPNPQFPIHHSQFSVIASNPPYIPQSESKLMHSNVVQFEPLDALFVPDNDPLLYYRAILAFADKSLSANGFLYLEMHENLAGEVQSLFKEHGYQQVSVRTDLHSKPRMLKAGR